MNDETLPDDVYNEIINGLQRFITLRAEGFPSEDMVSLVAQEWETIFLSQSYHLDWQNNGALRVKKAFLTLATRARRFPMPIEVLELIEPVRQTIQQETKWELTDEERKRNNAKFADIMAELAKKKRMA